jgi:hypothetical protein
MQRKRSSTRMAQRAIILQVLRDDHDRLWTRRELRVEVSDVTRYAFDMALALLEGDLCISFEDRGDVQASICAQHLDELGLISI